MYKIALMKKTMLYLLAAAGSLTALRAQPVLTAANMNPVHGDFFSVHFVDTNVSHGAAGANVTWNYASATQTGFDSIMVYACDSTPYCSTFPGSNIAELSGGAYEYFNAISTKLTITGVHNPFADLVLSNTADQLRYPFTYNSVYADTLYYGSSVLDDYYTEIDSFIYDGYGTLILPSGTDTGVVRIHNITYYHDSTSSSVDDGRMETYYWYKPGCHNALLVIDYDTVGSTTGQLYVADATYFVPRANTTAVENIASLKASIDLYPNPATDVLHIQFKTPRAASFIATITDVTGRIIKTITRDNITTGSGDIEYPVTDLQSGIYFVRLQSDAGNITKKFTVSR